MAHQRGERIMAVKSSRDIATSLSGSAFRRVVYDGRTRMLRDIPTLGRLEGRPARRAARPSSKAVVGVRAADPSPVVPPAPTGGRPKAGVQVRTPGPRTATPR